VLDFSSTGFHNLTRLYDASGDVVATESFTTDGGDTITVNGVVAEQLIEAGGTYRGMNYAYYVLDYSSTGFHNLTRLYDASGDVVASDTFHSNGAYSIFVQTNFLNKK
jgi:hypothetical protein